MAAILTRVIELMGDKDVKVAMRAVSAAGYLMKGHSGKREISAPLLEALFKLSTSKAEDLQFAGEGGIYVSV
jgi:hypothetical protein